ncbi:MAG: glycosyltransferase family 4 protein [Candidatus Levybacteria bacterium]|nr:glycosyltransferase family 4 protein [Candidatus Levybacteria bacterium]
MRVLILNWRDSKNPKSGGAEILTHEMAKGLVNLGNEVIQFSSLFKGAKKEEIIDGVRIIRRGKWWTVHILAFFYYLIKLRKKVDIVIDEVHWFPFFAVLYAGNKTILLACEVANKLFFNFFPYPLALVGRAIEKIYMILYRDIPVLAISPSTKSDLIKEGFSKDKITILPLGINLPHKFLKADKEKSPTLVYVGRLIKTKGIEDAILACKELRKEFQDIKLWVIGRGNKTYEKSIKKLILSLNLENQIIFLGFVSENKKFEMMQRAHLLISPSAKEGFGLTIPEAGIVGTPAVGYNVEGLRDVIVDGKSGLLVDCNHKALAEGIKKILIQKKIYKMLQQGAMSYAGKLNWNKTADKALAVLAERIKI